MSNNLIRINSRDNVAVAIKALMKGDVVTVDGDTFTVFSDIPAGHKVALCDIKKDESVIKYGYPIGAAKEDIKKGYHVHAFNIHTLLNEDAEYHYDRAIAEEAIREAEEDKLRWEGHSRHILSRCYHYLQPLQPALPKSSICLCSQSPDLPLR